MIMKHVGAMKRRGEIRDEPVKIDTTLEIFSGLTVHEEPDRGAVIRYFVRARAANGEIMFTTEGYTRKTDAKRSARRISNLGRCEIKELS